MNQANPRALDDPAAGLAPGRFVDSDAPEVIAYAEHAVGDARDELEKARRLYLAVRDDLRYDPYRISAQPEEFRASRTLRRGYGFCITKAAVLAAVARAANIPARLGFADVRNHLCTPKLRELMGGSDIFVFHGFTEFYLLGKWVKATPAFNRSLCEKAQIPPLEFDGVHDSIFHPYDPAGRRHMEYLRFRGVYHDIPFEEMLACFIKAYGEEIMLKLAEAAADSQRDFEGELCHG